MHFRFYIGLIWDFEAQQHSVIDFDVFESDRPEIPKAVFDIEDFPSPGLQHALYFSLPKDSDLGRRLFEAFNSEIAGAGKHREN